MTYTIEESRPFDLLADLFAYPEEGFAHRVEQIAVALEETLPAVAAELTRFREFVRNAEQIEVEEVYTRSFDVQAITTIDIGYVLFGDDYKRGALLVNLNREESEAGVDPGNELADHLPNVLRLLGRMEDMALRQELVEKIVAPAVNKIIGEFTPEKVESKNNIYRKHYKTLIERSDNYSLIYQQPLKAVAVLLNTFFNLQSGGEGEQIQRSTADFLGTVGKEIAIEG
ncbi:MAG: hypothetical protein KDD67_15555 [Ignavibacteriae bacterium]|nr:hypothetical protein [Ignavibacteriota bacterium]MCB9215763.1 hypothetical protein [Ignavibacteria bacterium]